MPDPRLGPFEPRRVRARKRRVAAGFSDAAFLHMRAAEDLAERLEAIARDFPLALSLGGGATFRHALHVRPALAARIGRLIEADIGGGQIEIDLERMPFAPQTFDLIVSPLALHWANDLPGVFIQLRHALKPDGLMLASLLGGDTLIELRQSLLRAESEITGGATLRISPFADLQDIAGLLQRAGFALPAADRDVLSVRYGEPMRLLADLRAMGETAAFAERGGRGLSRRILARTFEIYRQHFSDQDARVRATFDILTATGWAPHESQQKPLKPGSAKARLADALKTKEQDAGEKAG